MTPGRDVPFNNLSPKAPIQCILVRSPPQRQPAIPPSKVQLEYYTNTTPGLSRPALGLRRSGIVKEAEISLLLLAPEEADLRFQTTSHHCAGGSVILTSNESYR